MKLLPIKIYFVILFCFSIYSMNYAQTTTTNTSTSSTQPRKEKDDSIGHKYYNKVQFDLYNNTITGYLPFDVPFVLEGNLPSAVNRIEILYIPKQDISIYLIQNKTKKPTDTTRYRNKLVTSWNRYWDDWKCKKKKPHNISTYINNTTLLDTLTPEEKEKLSANMNKTLDLQFYTLFENVPDQYWQYSEWKRSAKGLKTDPLAPEKFNIYMQPLKANREYVFLLRITYGLSSDGTEKTKIVELFKELTTPVIKASYEVSKTVDLKSLDANFPRSFIDNVSSENEKAIFKMVNGDPLNVNADLLKDNYDIITEYIIYLFNQKYGLNVSPTMLRPVIIEQFKPVDFTKIVNLNTDYLDAIEKVESRAKVMFLGGTSELENALAKLKFTDDLVKLQKFKTLQQSYSVGESLLLGRSDFTGSSDYLKPYDEVLTKDEYNKYIMNVDKLTNELDQFVSIGKTKWNEENSFEFYNPDRLKVLRGEIEAHNKKITEWKKEAEKNKTKIDSLEAIVQQVREKIKVEGSPYKTQIIGLYDTLTHFSSKIKYGIKYDLVEMRSKLGKIDEFWKQKTDRMVIQFEQRSDIASGFQNTTSNSFMTRAEYYISADLGLAGMFFGDQTTSSFGFKTIQPYLGVNFNVCAINRQAHYGIFASSLSKSYHYKHPILRSSSFVLGVTTQNVAFDVYENDYTIKGLWNERPNLILLTGFALRASDYVRFSIGASWYKYRVTNNPLSTEQWKLTPGLYFGVSLDFDVRKYIGVIGSSIFPGLFNQTSKI